uniref:Ig-like domain-containing protein n=1 Tax=Fundulus heteroclitus TaxID=8078 RepID=A0A3Q2QKB2_FUNHE
HFIFILYFLLLLFMYSPFEQVHQVPESILKSPGAGATIKCSHSIPNYDRILWYKQMNGGQLELLGYMYITQSYPEPGLDVKLSGNADRDQTCALTLEALNPNSSAVYFCAASLTTLHIAAPHDKNLSVFSSLCCVAHTALHLDQLALFEHFFFSLKGEDLL